MISGTRQWKQRFEETTALASEVKEVAMSQGMLAVQLWNLAKERGRSPQEPPQVGQLCRHLGFDSGKPSLDL